MRRTTPIATVLGLTMLGVVAAAGVVYAADEGPRPVTVPSSGRPTPSPTQPTTLRPLTSEEIDVLAEGDDADHPWESCTIDGVTITCPDGWTGEYPAPEDDGSIYAAGAFTSQAHLTRCKGVDREPHLPCRVLMRPTYVVGGDGVRHEECYVTLVNAEDSQMVCRDDTVWPS